MAIDKSKTTFGYTYQEYKIFKKEATKYLLIFSLLYCCLYCTRNNLSAVSAVLISDLNWTKADLGIVTGIYFWTYGIGQLINGRLSEIVGPKRFLFISSIASIGLNLLFAYQRNLLPMAIIWGINGYVQAMAWPAGMSMLAKWWPGNRRGFATGFALAMSGLGQVITTLSVVIGLSLLPQMSWRSAFVIPTAFPFVMCVIFVLFCKPSPSHVGLNDYIEENEKKAQKEEEHKRVLESKGSLYPYKVMLANKKFRVWIFVAFLQGLIRYGLVSWIPLYYVEKFGVDVTSGLLQSLALPMGMAIGTLVVPWLTDTYCPNNRIAAASISGIIATISVACFALLNPTITWQMIIIELLLFVAGFAIYAVTGCVWAYSTDIGGRMFSGTAAGILNFSQYMGAAIQAVLYGFLLDSFGWNLIFVSVCVFNMIISIIGIINKKSNKVTLTNNIKYMKIVFYLNKIVKKICKKNNNSNIWIFGEWFGNRCCDNSLYLANYIASLNNDINIYWIKKEKTNTNHLNKKIKVLIMDEPETIKTINMASVIIVNQGFVDIISNPYFLPKKALAINLWHSGPWKKILYDVNKTNIKFLLAKTFNRYFYDFDSFLSTSKKFDKILKNNFSTNDSFIVKAGYPRNSIFYDRNNIAKNKTKICNLFKIDISKKLLIYAPTFRDNNDYNFDFSELLDNERLIEILKKNDALILQKKHYVNSKHRYSKSNSEYIINIDNEISTQELLIASDILITDYSGIFFDYLLLNRPIIHYLYDYDYYKNKDRGLYYSKEEVVCGDCPETIDDLLIAIEDNLANPDKYKELRKQRKQEYMTYESKDSCKIIYEEILKRLNKND